MRCCLCILLCFVSSVFSKNDKVNNDSNTVIHENVICSLHSIQELAVSKSPKVDSINALKGKKPVWMRGSAKGSISLQNGALRWYNKGEWGGALLFENSMNDTTYLLISDNIKSVFTVTNGYIAIAGLAHMSMDTGAIYCVHDNLDGTFNVNRLHSLHSSPVKSVLLPGDEVHLILRTGDELLIDANGNVKNKQ